MSTIIYRITEQKLQSNCFEVKRSLTGTSSKPGYSEHL